MEPFTQASTGVESNVLDPSQDATLNLGHSVMEKLDVSGNSVPHFGPHKRRSDIDAHTKRLFLAKNRRKNIIETSDATKTEERRWKTETEKAPEIAKLLKKHLEGCFLFEGLDSADLDSLVRVIRSRNVKAGQLVVKEGNKGDVFYLVQEGKLSGYKKQSGPRKFKLDPDDIRTLVAEEGSSTGSGDVDECYEQEEVSPEEEFSFDATDKEEMFLRHYGPGDSFGERALLFQQRRAASIVADTECVLWMLDRTTFRYACKKASESNYAQALEAMSKISILKTLTQEQMEYVASCARHVEYQPGTQIIAKGTTGETLYIIKKGRVKVTNGLTLVPNEVQESFLDAGDYFGELALLYNRPREADVFAEDHTILIGVPKKACESILGPNREQIDDNIRAYAVQNIGLFKNLDSEKRLKLFKLFKEERHSRGSVLIQQGAMDKKCFILRSGRAIVQKRIASGSPTLPPQDKILAEVAVGSFFGEMALVLNQPRAASVICQTDCDVYSLEAKDMEVFESTTQEELVKEALKMRDENNIVVNNFRRQVQEAEIRRLLQQAHQQPSFSASLPSQVTYQRQQLRSLIQPPKPLIDRSTKYDLKEFRSVCTLGTGTFGRVKLVLHQATGKTFALKIQPKYHIMKYNLRDSVFNEKRIMMAFNHPFICCLHQTSQDDHYLYMLLEFVPGGELFSLLQNYGPQMQPSHHRFYSACVVLALEALHQRNVIYRDLKPENLMVDQLGYLKLVDFGFAKPFSDQVTKTYTFCGTPEYFSPELVLGQGYGKPNDVWALGVLIYEIISGCTPFGNSNDPKDKIYHKIVNGALMFPKDCYDQGAMQLISGLLEKRFFSRLGCDRFGISSVKSHPWFATVDWTMLLMQRLDSPWKPPLASNMDTSNFDKYNEQYKIVRFQCDPANDPFKGF